MSSAGWSLDDRLRDRAAVHAALGEPARLAIVEELATSDRSPGELADRLAIASNLLAHHLDVLESVGLVWRSASAGDGRRKYVHVNRAVSPIFQPKASERRSEMLFVCSHNSARSQLAAALWTARTGCRASSAGTRPARRVNRGAVAAARRAGVSLAGAVPRMLELIPAAAQVVTVCDVVHEELEPGPDWWHWSIPDPVAVGTVAAFDAVVAELDARISMIATPAHDDQEGSR